MERLTINDIANLAEVSTATVSNFLNGNFNKMSAKTRQHLAEIIEQTNYRPNSTARDLAKSESRTIGVSIADITHPFTSAVLSGISEICDQYGYKVIFTNADNNSQNEINNIMRLRSENVAGFILDPVNSNSPIYKAFNNQSAVMVDRQAEHLTMDTVVTDNAQAVCNMTKQMLNKGYDEVYFVSWPLAGISTREQRYQGFLSATNYSNNDHLLTIPQSNSSDTAFSEKLRSIMQQTSSRKIGFFTMNAQVLLQLLKIMQINNYQYAKDYGVATYEEFEWMKVMNPSISCIHQDSRKIGQTAAKILLDKLKQKTLSQPTITEISTNPIIRESF